LADLLILAIMFIWRYEGRLSELFCVVLCTEAVHTQISSSYSSLDRVLSHWALFTVRRFVFICVYFVCFCFIPHRRIVVVLMSAWWGGPDGIEV